MSDFVCRFNAEFVCWTETEIEKGNEWMIQRVVSFSISRCILALSERWNCFAFALCKLFYYVAESQRVVFDSVQSPLSKIYSLKIHAAIKHQHFCILCSLYKPCYWSIFALAFQSTYIIHKSTYFLSLCYVC